MTSQYGKDWRIGVGNGANPEVFAPIGGEKSFDWKRSSDTIDLSSKDDGAYKSTGYGQQAVTISVSGTLKLPDPGLQAISDASKASPPQIDVKILNGAIVKFAGTVGVGNLSITATNNDAITYSFDLTNIGAPTVDALGATQ